LRTHRGDTLPGKLEYYKKDPEGKGRGAGKYFHRGKGVYSKYSEDSDIVKIHKLRKKRRTKKQRQKWQHLEDTREVRRGGKVVGRI